MCCGGKWVFVGRDILGGNGPAAAFSCGLPVELYRAALGAHGWLISSLPLCWYVLACSTALSGIFVI